MEKNKVFNEFKFPENGTVKVFFCNFDTSDLFCIEISNALFELAHFEKCSIEVSRAIHQLLLV